MIITDRGDTIKSMVRNILIALGIFLAAVIGFIFVTNQENLPQESQIPQTPIVITQSPTP